jgi:5-(carboxyamino)imidazole ribonucleotide mutase
MPSEPATPLVGEPLVGVIMGSKSDYATMRAAVEILREFGVPYEAKVVSAHRTPELMFKYAGEAASRGLRVIIAGAGGAAHLPGMVAARTTLPVLGVPIAVTALQGLDALLSIVQMPKGIPVGTLAIGAPGAANAGLLAVQILASADPELTAKLTAWRGARRDEVLLQTLEDARPVEQTKPVEAAEPLDASKVLEDSKSLDDPEPEVIR